MKDESWSTKPYPLHVRTCIWPDTKSSKSVNHIQLFLEWFQVLRGRLLHLSMSSEARLRSLQAHAQGREIRNLSRHAKAGEDPSSHRLMRRPKDCWLVEPDMAGYLLNASQYEKTNCWARSRDASSPFLCGCGVFIRAIHMRSHHTLCSLRVEKDSALVKSPLGSWITPRNNKDSRKDRGLNSLVIESKPMLL